MTEQEVAAKAAETIEQASDEASFEQAGQLREHAPEEFAFNAFKDTGSLRSNLRRSVNESVLNHTMSEMFSQDLEDEYVLEDALSKIEARLNSFKTHSKMM